MARTPWLLLLLQLTCWGVYAAKPSVEVEVSGPNGAPFVLRGVVPPTQDSALLAASLGQASPLALVEARPNNGCTPIQVQPNPKGPFAVVIRRGTCEFRQKIVNAQKAGAQAVLIIDSVATFYDFSASEPRLKVSEGGPCLLRCDLGEGTVPTSVSRASLLAGLPGTSCAAAPGCTSGICGVSGEKVDSAYRACCIPDKFVQMNLGNRTDNQPKIPAVFLGASAAVKLEAALGKAGVSVRIADSGFGFGWLVSAFLIWVLGCSVEALSTWFSAHAEREWVSSGGSPTMQKRQHQPEESVEMTVGTAMCYLAVATIGLVGLFLFIQQDARAVVFVMIGVFSMATVSVITNLGTYPVMLRVAPHLDEKVVDVPCCGRASVAWLVGFAISLSAVVYWVVARHTGYAWIFQDTFAIFVCCQFVQALRMNSIKVSYALLVSFMVYDIFMVFISPVIFKSSVMVTVAQAGSGSTSISKENPFVCLRVPDERMPMLFMLPRLGSDGEYAMLGLGDVLLPGLLLSFMLRYDTLAQRNYDNQGCGGPVCYFCNRYPYWTLGIVGYVFGLLLAFLANTFGFTIFEVKGQPALLYLVPCTLIPLTLLALARGEFGQMWEGPQVLRTPLSPVQARAPEGQSLLKPADAV